MKKISILFILFFPILFFGQETKKSAFTIHAGNAYNFPTTLYVHQKGLDDFSTKINFATEAFVLPPYWDLKYERRFKSFGMSLRLTHHKLIMTNKHPLIDGFQISHGYNMLLLGISKPFKYFDLGFGLGTSLSHPEGTIRNRPIDNNTGFNFGGYYKFSPPVIEVLIAKKVNLWENLFLSIEGRANYGFLRLKIRDGYIKTTPLCLHLNYGLGYNF